MFLHYILNCDMDETISKVFWAQENDPISNDWSETIKEDLKTLELNRFSQQEIGSISKIKMKQIIKEACKKTAFKHLVKEIKDRDMSKLKNLKYEKLELQPYLKSNKLNLRKKKILFKARTRMLNVKWNFARFVR